MTDHRNVIHRQIEEALQRHGREHERSMYCTCGLWTSDVDEHRADVVMQLVQPELDRRDETIGTVEADRATIRGLLGSEKERADKAIERETVLERELERLTAGQEEGYDPLTVPTPGQWIARFNDATAAERLDVVKGIIAAGERANRCFAMAHESRLDEDQKASVAVARVQDVIADMEGTTGARHWARILRTAVDADQPKANPAATQATEPHTGLVVQPYRERGKDLWVFRCWGDDHCDGLVSLDHTSQQWAEAARDRHLAEDHKIVNPPVQCWHTEANTPCDWDVCKQPDRIAAGGYGTDPREQH